MNSQRGQVSTIAIVLLVVGLVVGAGGCYFAVSNTFEQKARDYEDMISGMEQDITDYESQVTDYESQVTDLIADHELQVYHLINEIMVLEALVGDMQSELDELEQIIKDHEATIVEKENDISDLQESMADYEEQLSTLESKIQVLESMSIPSTGYEKFSAYGFSFEYPKQMYLSIMGNLETSANVHSGLVMANKLDETELFFVSWVDSIYPRDLDIGLEDGFAFMEYGGDFVRGERVTLTISGHEMKYQDYTITIEGKTYQGVAGVWNCDIRERVYSLNYIDAGEDALSPFLQYLEYFICHSSYS